MYSLINYCKANIHVTPMQVKKQNIIPSPESSHVSLLNHNLSCSPRNH